VWQGRGANIFDTRSCNACAYQSPNVTEVKRRVDELVAWGATFMRLDLESYATSGGRVHWAGVLSDPAYLADLQEIVRHIGTKPGVRVMISLWQDPTFTSLGWPTDATAQVWRKLAQTFAFQSHVLFGLVNEPQSNYDGALNSQVWTAMNNTAAAIRAVEDSLGAPYHVIVVQGTGGWSRHVTYYVTHPITAGGGRNIAYEVHFYNPMTDFNTLIGTPSLTIPLIIGEFGPVSGYQTEADAAALMDRLDQLRIPWTAWAFHMRCSPNLLVDYSGGGCGVGMPLAATGWGGTVKSRLSIVR
jgi:hypothetical protein